MRVSVDDYEAVMAIAELIVARIGSEGIQTDPIDVAADIYSYMRQITDSDEVGFISCGGVTVLYLPEDDEEPASYNVYIDAGKIGADGVHYVFDGPKLEYMDSVPEEMIEEDEGI